MTDTNQKQLGSTLWSIADQLCWVMDADDFRDDIIFLSGVLNRIIFVAPRK